jgi:hypothetical protein
MAVAQILYLANVPLTCISYHKDIYHKQMHNCYAMYLFYMFAFTNVKTMRNVTIHGHLDVTSLESIGTTS